MVKLLAILLVISLLAMPMVGCAKPLTLRITTPKDGITITESPVRVAGYVPDSKVVVTVGSTEVQPNRKGYFFCRVELTEGENIIKVVAKRGKPGNWKETVEKTITAIYAPLPALSLEITSPEDGATLTESPVAVSGTVPDPEATITVNDVGVEVAEDGTFSADVELTEGENTINIVATLGEETLTKTVTVTYTPSE